MLDTFYRDIRKSLIHIFIYALQSINLCGNTNVIARTGSLTGFKQRPTVLKFGTDILKRDLKSLVIFSQIVLDFFKEFSKIFSWIFLQAILLFHDIF